MNKGIVSIIVVAVLIFGAMIFRGSCVSFVDSYEVGYKFDKRTGQVTLLTRTGYFINVPIVVQVHSIDLRPQQVCLSANQRVLNCKLVQFNPEGLELFLSWHGRNDYVGGSYRGQDGEQHYYNLSEILKVYAFDPAGKEYPFLKVLDVKAQ